MNKKKLEEDEFRWPHDVGERWLSAEKELDELKSAVEVIARICGLKLVRKKNEN